MNKKYIYGYTSFENSYEVENYPWGFRLRTEVRYWIETVDKKQGGQRFCKCTKDPRNGKWCTPKKSTYYALGTMYLDENGHVEWEAVYDGNSTNLGAFVETHREYLSEYQIKEIKRLKAYQKVMEKVEFSFVVNPSKEDAEKMEQNRNESIAKINMHINQLAKTEEI